MDVSVQNISQFLYSLNILYNNHKLQATVTAHITHIIYTEADACMQSKLTKVAQVTQKLRDRGKRQNCAAQKLCCSRSQFSGGAIFSLSL